MTENISARELLVEIRAILRIPPHSVQFNDDLHHSYRGIVIDEIIARINYYIQRGTEND